MSKPSIHDLESESVFETVVFQFGLRVKTESDVQAEEAEQAALQAVQQGLGGALVVQQASIGLDDQPEPVEEESQVVWSGLAQVAMSLDQTDTQSLMGVENSVVTAGLEDPSGVCKLIELAPIPGIMPKVVSAEESSSFLGAALRTVSDMITESGHRRPAGWYSHPDGGYRYWSGYGWEGASVDQPPHTHH